MPDDKDGKNINNDTPQDNPLPKPQPPATTLTDEQIEAALSDERIFKHARFKELAAAKKERDDLLKKQEAAQKKQLEEQGKWEELAKQNEQKALEATEKAKQTLIKATAIAEASKLGAHNPEVVAKLLSTNSVEVSDDGQVTGIDTALEQLKTDNAYLFGSSTPQAAPPVSNPTNPSDDTQPMKFTHSQITDPAFYAKHEAEIDRALASGEIVDDLATSTKE